MGLTNVVPMTLEPLLSACSFLLCDLFTDSEESCDSRFVSRRFCCWCLWLCVFLHVWGPALVWPRASLITHLQAAPLDPLLSLDFSHTIAFYSDSSEMGLHCLESPSKSRIRQYSQNQAVWLGSIYSGYCSNGFFPVQSHSVPFLIESLDQFTVSPKVYSSW